MSDIKEKIDSILIDVQNQSALMLFDRTQGLGLAFSVNRVADTVQCTLMSEDQLVHYCRFSVSPMIVNGGMELRIRVTAHLADQTFFKEAETCLVAITALMDVARMIDKTYCQTWRVDL